MNRTRFVAMCYNHSKKLIMGIVLMMIFSLGITAQAGISPCAGIEQGAPAPDFTLKDLNGKKHSLSEYRGQVVLLNFWATWCGPCVHEMPSMESLSQKLKEDDFVILAVSLDRGNLGRVKEFVKKHHLSFPVLLSPDGKIQKLYPTSAIPVSLLINKDGTIHSCIGGSQKWDSQEAVNYIKGALDEQP